MGCPLVEGPDAGWTWTSSLELDTGRGRAGAAVWSTGRDEARVRVAAAVLRGQRPVPRPAARRSLIRRSPTSPGWSRAVRGRFVSHFASGNGWGWRAGSGDESRARLPRRNPVGAGFVYPAVAGIALSINTAAMAAAVGKDSVLRTRVRAEAPSSSSASCSPSCSGSMAPASRAVLASRAAMAFL